MNIEEIKVLWDKRKESIKLDSVRFEEVNKGWENYKDKILEDSLTLENYASRVSRSDASSLQGGYLCNFLENASSDVYGSAKPGSSYGYAIRASEKAGSYKIKDKEYTLEDEEVKNLFGKIKDQLKALVEADAELSTILILEKNNSPISGMQILRKICVLNCPEVFLAIYSDGAIDKLCDLFKIENEEDSTNLSKNKALATYLFDELKVKEPIEKLKLAKFLYELVSAHSIFDTSSPNVIYYGPPGTGKTYSIRKSLELLQVGGNAVVEYVQFHPSYSYEDFIEGVKPLGITSGGQINFAMTNGKFKQFCIDAKASPEKQFYFVIDEINRANLSSVFGELLYCLEYRYPTKGTDEEKRAALISTQYSSLISSLPEADSNRLSFEKVGNEVFFGIPDNVHVIGTMNDIDKSVDSFDLALRRRFKWIRTQCNYDVIEEELSAAFSQDFITDYKKRCEALNEYISGEKGLNLGPSYEFGHYYFLQVNDMHSGKRDLSKKKITTVLTNIFEQHLQPVLKEYLRGEYSEQEIEKKGGRIDQAKERFVGKTGNNDND